MAEPVIANRKLDSRQDQSPETTGLVILPGPWETVRMPTRGLKDRAYVDGVPTFGRCSKCGRPFTTSLAEAVADAGKATRDFYTAFDAHKCDEDANQAAARIVREASNSH